MDNNEYHRKLHEVFDWVLNDPMLTHAFQRESRDENLELGYQCPGFRMLFCREDNVFTIMIASASAEFTLTSNAPVRWYNLERICDFVAQRTFRWDEPSADLEEQMRLLSARIQPYFDQAKALFAEDSPTSWRADFETYERRQIKREFGVWGTVRKALT